MPKTAGRIHRDGLTASATVLVAALEAAQKDRETADTLTHPFHTYPARLHPATAKILVEFLGEGATRTQPIVDPFCGQGTVLAVANELGLDAVGVELNRKRAARSRVLRIDRPPREAGR